MIETCVCVCVYLFVSIEVTQKQNIRKGGHEDEMPYWAWARDLIIATTI